MSAIDTTPHAAVTMPSDTELVITRDFDAPRQLVFECLTTPEHVRQWYGMSEDGFLVCEIDFQVGGRWHYVLAGEPGTPDHSFSGEYLEIDAPQRWVATESYDNMPGASYVVTVTLEEIDGITRLTSHLAYPAKELRDGHVASGMEYGMNISYNRLAALLGQLRA